MIDSDRLAELDTFRVDDDTPDDATIRLPARDVRDLVQLISVVRAAIELRDSVVDEPGSRGSSVGVMEALRRFDEERCAT